MVPWFDKMRGAARPGRRLGRAGIAALAVVALSGALSGCDGSAADTPGKASAQTAALPPRPVRVAMVALEPAAETIHYAAVIRPRFEADIGFRVAGKVTQRLVDVGTRVTPGMALARLDADDLNLQVRALQAQLVAAEAELRNARGNLDRAQRLVTGRLVHEAGSG